MMSQAFRTVTVSFSSCPRGAEDVFVVSAIPVTVPCVQAILFVENESSRTGPEHGDG